MAWEWSHTNEAYHTAEKNLRKKSRKWLEECYGEIRADKRTEEEQHRSPFFDEEVYEKVLQGLKTGWQKCWNKDDIADFIWEYASNILRTCDNGGFNAWMCPHGCHTVSFD